MRTSCCTTGTRSSIPPMFARGSSTGGWQLTIVPKTGRHFDGCGLFRNLSGNTLPMTSFDTSHVKNIVLLGHAGSGKTTLSECMLYEAGLTTRRGSVEERNTVSDFY